MPWLDVSVYRDIQKRYVSTRPLGLPRPVVDTGPTALPILFINEIILEKINEYRSQHEQA